MKLTPEQIEKESWKRANEDANKEEFESGSKIEAISFIHGRQKYWLKKLQGGEEK